MEVVWAIKHTDVGGLWQDDEARVGHLLLENVSQRERDQCIVLAPEQQSRSGHGGNLLAYYSALSGSKPRAAGSGVRRAGHRMTGSAEIRAAYSVWL
jgi:hypothetical protein